MEFCFQKVFFAKGSIKELEKKCKVMNSNIIFLTARPSSMKEMTHEHLRSLYPTMNYNVYFSSEKGYKIKEIIETSPRTYDHIVFVDDKIHNIKDVEKALPSAECYQFDPTEYIINYELLTNKIAS